MNDELLNALIISINRQNELIENLPIKMSLYQSSPPSTKGIEDMLKQIKDELNCIDGRLKSIDYKMS